MPDLTASDLRLATPRVFVARNGREYPDLKADTAPVPTALREFRRTDRLLVRFDAFGKADGRRWRSRRELLNRQGQKMSDLPVAAPAADRTPSQVDLPLSSLAAGEYLLEVSAAARGPDAGDRAGGVQGDWLVQTCPSCSLGVHAAQLRHRGDAVDGDDVGRGAHVDVVALGGLQHGVEGLRSSSPRAARSLPSPTRSSRGGPAPTRSTTW